MIVGSVRPYPPSGLTTALWRRITPEVVALVDLVTTQRHLDIGALVDGALRPGSDVLPHVVQYGGRRYLEDGHHRVIRAQLRGHDAVIARVHHCDSERPCET